MTDDREANMSLESGESASLSLPPSLFQLFPNTSSFTLLFAMYSSSVLLPQAPESQRNESIRVASSVIGATLFGHKIEELSNATISITLKLENPVS